MWKFNPIGSSKLGVYDNNSFFFKSKPHHDEIKYIFFKDQQPNERRKTPTCAIVKTEHRERIPVDRKKNLNRVCLWWLLWGHQQHHISPRMCVYVDKVRVKSVSQVHRLENNTCVVLFSIVMWNLIASLRLGRVILVLIVPTIPRLHCSSCCMQMNVLTYRAVIFKPIVNAPVVSFECPTPIFLKSHWIF